MCHHWTRDSVEERLAEREEAGDHEDEPEVAVELDREHEDDRDPAEIPTADD